jgi:hypothetical protein
VIAWQRRSYFSKGLVTWPVHEAPAICQQGSHSSDNSIDKHIFSCISIYPPRNRVTKWYSNGAARYGHHLSFVLCLGHCEVSAGCHLHHETEYMSTICSQVKAHSVVLFWCDHSWPALFRCLRNLIEVQLGFQTSVSTIS